MRLLVYIVEVLNSALVVFVVCRVSLDKMIPGYISGLCVGGAYFAVTLSTGRLIGSGVNPALSLPTAILNSDYDNIVMYFTAPFIGAVVGVFLYLILANEIDSEKEGVVNGETVMGSVDNIEDRGIGGSLRDGDVTDRFVDEDNEEMIREE